MSIDIQIIKKVQQRGEYKKIKPELKFQILQELEFNSIKELSKKYGIARQTIASYKKAKEHIYDRFKGEVLSLVYYFVDMRLEGNPTLSEQAIKKDIKLLLKTREYFIYSEMNFLKDYIPETKKYSQKKRIIRFVMKQSLFYFNQQKQKQLSRVDIQIPQQQQQIIQIQDQRIQQQNSEQEVQIKFPYWYVDESSYIYCDLPDEWQIE
ncbi:unnamed protein product (macronuclear) [Paramecium tetraurelia]|uniref:HTH psq-type domain-containing protein n=1 Tax=Paramecium tetraurelia TaxID=5888 RepID=A0C717_PARTE|nr:uncharacterized protein GSPATT00035714001 [Paramecium tetraurelia]CAK66584.1 unnamed protein product [Paramecium tetraurelia]|eukprot:XP_001433981.1 hypothetical protein (macronuclear) [Paramecium tetraurelia strain d4-2]